MISEMILPHPARTVIFQQYELMCIKFVKCILQAMVEVLWENVCTILWKLHQLLEDILLTEPGSRKQMKKEKNLTRVTKNAL